MNSIFVTLDMTVPKFMLGQNVLAIGFSYYSENSTLSPNRTVLLHLGTSTFTLSPKQCTIFPLSSISCKWVGDVF